MQALSCREIDSPGVLLACLVGGYVMAVAALWTGMARSAMGRAIRFIPSLKGTRFADNSRFGGFREGLERNQRL